MIHDWKHIYSLNYSIAFGDPKALPKKAGKLGNGYTNFAIDELSDLTSVRLNHSL